VAGAVRLVERSVAACGTPHTGPAFLAPIAFAVIFAFRKPLGADVFQRRRAAQDVINGALARLSHCSRGRYRPPQTVVHGAA
jgi:hypothetical protein